MAVNILIGVGGTGAKIVESALFLLSAGVGSRDEVLVGLVDQDNSNGNVVRTEQLLNLLVNLRRGFQAGSPNRVDWSEDGDEGTALFSVPLAPLLPGGAHWRPAPDSLPTLRDVLRHESMPREEQALFDLLFRGDDAEPADAEQTMNLAEGYRGRAHVGAAALVSAVHFDQPEFRSRLLELMKRSSGGEEVRIFIAGSLFGGTGAAGFPTIARTLHRMRAPGNANRIQGDKVMIGGALMLPYFQFGEPQDEQANVITSAQLLPQARVAIEFYQNLLQQEGVFDRLYVSGWEKMFQLGYHEAGRAEQRNPALPPELVAATAVADFFTVAAEGASEGAPLVSARRDAGAFGWEDLPARKELRLYDRLGNALRFALWWRYRAEPAIDDRGMFGSIRTPWLKALAEGTEWQNDTPAARENLKAYAERLLEWTAAMRLFSTGVVGDFALWNGDGALSRSDPRQPTDPVGLRESRSEPETERDLSELLRARDDNDPPAGSSMVFDRLNRRPATGGSSGLGRVVAGVYRATRPARDA